MRVECPPSLADHAIDVVATVFEVPRDEILRDRTVDISRARKVVCRLLWLQGHGSPTIGRLVGRNHSSVWQSLRTLENEMAGYPALRELVEECERLMKARLPELKKEEPAMEASSKFGTAEAAGGRDR